MLIISVFLGFAFSFLFGGSLSNLSKIQLTGLWLPLIAAVLKSTSSYLCAYSLLPRDFIFPMCVIIFYLMCLIFVFINRKHLCFSVLAGIGLIMNFWVIAANDFYMPIAAAHLASDFSIPLINTASYCISSGSTRLKALCDIIYIPIRFVGGFASIGDILLALGIFALMLSLMGAQRKNKHINDKARAK